MRFQKNSALRSGKYLKDNQGWQMTFPPIQMSHDQT